MHMAHRHANPAYAEIVRNLKTQLKDLREELGEIDDQFPEIQKIIDENW
jgi:CHAD domain-containing protein